MYIMAERKCSYPDPTPEKADPDHLIILFSSIYSQNPFSAVILLNDVQKIVDRGMLVLPNLNLHIFLAKKY